MAGNRWNFKDTQPTATPSAQMLNIEIVFFDAHEVGCSSFKCLTHLSSIFGQVFMFHPPTKIRLKSRCFFPTCFFPTWTSQHRKNTEGLTSFRSTKEWSCTLDVWITQKWSLPGISLPFLFGKVTGACQVLSKLWNPWCQASISLVRTTNGATSILIEFANKTRY